VRWNRSIRVVERCSQPMGADLRLGRPTRPACLGNWPQNRISILIERTTGRGEDGEGGIPLDVNRNDGYQASIRRCPGICDPRSDDSYRPRYGTFVLQEAETGGWEWASVAFLAISRFYQPRILPIRAVLLFSVRLPVGGPLKAFRSVHRTIAFRATPSVYEQPGHFQLGPSCTRSRTSPESCSDA